MYESKYFSQEELKCKCGCNTCEMDEVFLQRLDMLRYRHNKPIYLNSAYRCPKHNKAVGGVDSSPHTLGIAVDIKVGSTESYWLLKYAFELGFKGIGVSQKGNNRFIHVDDKLGSPRPNIWSY